MNRRLIVAGNGKSTLRFGALAAACCVAALLAGCGTSSQVTVNNAAGDEIGGSVYGGQQPITGSTIQLYEVGTTGDGSAAKALITPVLTTSDGSGNAGNTNANAGNKNNSLPAGNFTITNEFTCDASADQVYIVATGGNPGLSAGSTNSDIALMTALGQCGNLSGTTQIKINELTTIGSIAPVAAYMTGYANLGSGTSDASQLVSALGEVPEYVNTTNGAVPGPSLPNGYTASTTALQTLGDIVGACINSTGPAGGSGGACGLLFNYATPPSSGVAPTDTVGAIIDILNNPTNNAANGKLYSLLPTTPPYTPTLSSTPSTWALPITAAGSTQLAIQIQPSNTASGSAISPAITVAIENASGQTETSATNAVSLSIAANPAAGTLSGTTTVNAINGIATFSNVSIDKAGTGYTLTASASNLTSATSGTFNITAGKATKLVYTTQPSSVPQGVSITPPVTVAVADSAGNTVTSSTASIAIAIGTNPSAGVLSGTSPVSAASGVASFSDLSISKSGNGYTLSATSAGLSGAISNTFNVTSPAISVGTTTVGNNFIQALSISLPNNAAANETMTIISSDPTHFLVSSSPTATGAASTTVQLTSGSSGVPAVYVQGQNYAGSTAITGTVTASAAGFSNGSGIVTLYPSGVGFYPYSNGAFSTTTMASATQLTLGLLALNPGSLTVAFQGNLGPQGASPNATIASDNTTVGTITGNPAVFTVNGSTYSQNVNFNPKGAGTANLSFSEPSGYSTPATSSGWLLSVAATVTAPTISVGAATVGNGFITSGSISLQTAPTASESMTITSSDPTHFLLSTSPTAIGTASITVTISPSNTSPTFYIEGQNYSGNTAITATLTASATGFTTGSNTLTLYPSGVGFYPYTNGTFSTTTTASATQLTVGLLALNPGTLTVAFQGNLGPQGASPNVTIVSDNTSIGTVTGNPSVFSVNGSTYSQNTNFNPVGGGTAHLSFSEPTGYSTPATSSGWLLSISAVVSAPTISVGAVTVGNYFITSGSISLQNPPTASESMTITSSDPTHFLLSTSPTAVGTGSITVTITPSSGNPTFYVEGQNYTGNVAITATLTASASGFTTGSNTLTLYPSGVGFYPYTNAAFSTTTFSAATQLTLGLLALNPGTLTVAFQGNLGPQGVAPSYTVASSNTSVGTITGNPGTFAVNGSTYSQTVNFNPASSGSSTLSFSEPSGYTTPAPSSGWLTSITATVTAPTATAGSATVGNGFITTGSVALQTAPPGSETMTITSGDPTHFLLSTSPTAIGTASITVSISPSNTSPTFYIEGQNYTGTTAITTTLTASAVGYTSIAGTLTLYPSGVAFYPYTNGAFSTTTTSSVTQLTLGLLALNPGSLTVAFQGNLGPQGTSPNATVVSGTTSVGTITGNPAVFSVNGSTYSQNVNFNPKAVGSSILSFSEPSGYTTPNTSSGWLLSITANVTQ